ncbi:uncharacterized protein LOC112592016 [Melanaphis sacchari]|uniref:uncharacterized protein LOC112592016 n=1 Tax=Melanaphis sacchari TaxID=742174 RepID=UPI000DC149FA|nr:uncharacterized protein LOC112592016 [Melanaphis sacchari]
MLAASEDRFLTFEVRLNRKLNKENINKLEQDYGQSLLSDKRKDDINVVTVHTMAPYKRLVTANKYHPPITGQYTTNTTHQSQGSIQEKPQPSDRGSVSKHFPTQEGPQRHING